MNLPFATGGRYRAVRHQRHGHVTDVAAEQKVFFVQGGATVQFVAFPCSTFFSNKHKVDCFVTCL